MSKIKSEAERILYNLCSVPSYKDQVSKSVFNYFMENFSTLIFCRGNARNVIFKHYAGDWYTVYSKQKETP